MLHATLFVRLQPVFIHSDCEAAEVEKLWSQSGTNNYTPLTLFQRRTNIVTAGRIGSMHHVAYVAKMHFRALRQQLIYTCIANTVAAGASRRD